MSEGENFDLDFEAAHPDRRFFTAHGFWGMDLCGLTR